MERDKIIDTLKYVLILLVVIGHTLPKFMGGGGILTHTMNGIYLFHMPLFVMLSGYFTHKQPMSKFKETIFALLMTLCVFELISLVLKAVIYHTLIPLHQPYWTLWYLFCLILWRTTVQVLPEIVLNKKALVLAVSIIASAFTPFIPLGYIGSFQRFFTFLPFFMIGYYMNHENMQRLRNINIAVPLIILVLCLAITAYVDQKLPVLKILRGAEHYRQFDEKAEILVCSKLFFFALSLISSLAIISIIRWTSNFTANEGTKSLVYYLYHGLVIEFILVPFVHISHFEQSIIVAIAASFICLLICYYLSKSRLFTLLTDPYRNIIKKYKL